MFQTAGRGRAISKKPSHYPPLAFHLIRIGQWLSALFVAIVIIYFVHHLHREGFPIPWTFLVLLTVSVLTLAAIAGTTILHFTRTLNPKVNLTANTALTILWLLGMALLSWNLSWTLGHRCIVSQWHNQTGVMVCRLYKATTAFTVTGILSTVLALALDVRVHRSSTQLGKYNQMLDVKGPVNARSISPYPSGTYAGEEVPEITVRGPSHDVQRPYKAQSPYEAQKFGYSHPEEQTSYGGGGASGDIAER